MVPSRDSGPCASPPADSFCIDVFLRRLALYDGRAGLVLSVGGRDTGSGASRLLLFFPSRESLLRLADADRPRSSGREAASSLALTPSPVERRSRATCRARRCLDSASPLASPQRRQWRPRRPALGRASRAPRFARATGRGGRPRPCGSVGRAAECSTARCSEGRHRRDDDQRRARHGSARTSRADSGEPPERASPTCPPRRPSTEGSSRPASRR